MERHAISTIAAIGLLAIVAVAAGGAVVVIGLGQSSPAESQSGTSYSPTSSLVAKTTMSTASTNSQWSALFGSWTAYSTAFYYDAGGGGAPPVGTFTLLINPDGTWSYGTSHGSWSVGSISSADWTRWHNDPQANMTQRIVLDGWDANGTKGVGDGPIQYSTSSPGQVDFVWVIFHVGPPLTSNPGEVFFKFGHSNLSG